MENQSKPRSSSAKSSRFPSITLDYAVKVVEEARKFGKDVTDTYIAGGKSVKSGAFIRKKASLGYYGLISGRGEKLQVTELAEKIVYPSNDSEKIESLKRAFLSPPLFNRLFSTMEKGVPIKLDILGNVVVREYGIQPAAREEFLSTFVKSGIYAQVLRYSNDSKDEIIVSAVEEPSNKTQSSQEKTENPVGDENELQSAEIFLSEGKARIFVPKKLSQDDAKKLKIQINTFANIFDDKD